MVPTLRTVLDLPGRPVRLRAGATALDRPVRWVATSELEDPTPYLEGGELLLTTGIRLTPDRFDGYVARLAEAGVAGLGLGVGLTHPSVPPELVAAAERYGLPLLEVPEPTPFIAISKAVSEVLAAGEYEAVTHAVEAQRDLTRAALDPAGASAVTRRLARELAADVLLLDPTGQPLEPVTAEGAALVDDLREELERLRARGPLASAAFSDAAGSVVVQPLAPAGRVRGYLAVRRPGPFTAVDHSLVNVAVALLSLSLERSAGADDARQALRAAVLALLVDGVPAGRLPLAEVGWAWLSDAEVRVLVADGSGPTGRRVLEGVDDAGPGDASVAGAVVDGRLVLLTGDDDAAEAGALGLGPDLAWGVAGPVAVAELADGLRQARQALAAAGASAGPAAVRRYRELVAGGVVGLVPPAAGRGFADALLGPLEARDRGDLVASVRAWLAHHGQWDAAAHDLGVHRHTLRYRMRRVEELLGRSLDDPDLRAELWLALAVRDRDAVDRLRP